MNKKLKSSFLLSTALFLSIGLHSASAEDGDAKNPTIQSSILLVEKPSSPIVDLESLQITETDGSITLFDNLQDMKTHLNYVDSNESYTESDNALNPAALGETLVGTQYKYNQFVGYSRFTPSWTYASQHVLKGGEEESFSSTIGTDWGNVSASFKRSYGVDTTIPANVSKLSKLGGYADFKIERYRISQPNLPTSYYKTKVITLDTYIFVVYK